MRTVAALVALTLAGAPATLVACAISCDAVAPHAAHGHGHGHGDEAAETAGVARPAAADAHACHEADEPVGGDAWRSSVAPCTHAGISQDPAKRADHGGLSIPRQVLLHADAIFLPEPSAAPAPGAASPPAGPPVSISLLRPLRI